MEQRRIGEAPVYGGRAAEPVLRTLNAYYPLSPADEAIVEGLAGLRTSHSAGDSLLARGGVRFLLGGWAAAQQTLADGRRQIFKIITPGEILGPAVRSDTPDWDVVALTPGRSTDARPALDAAYEGTAESLGAALSLAMQHQHRQLLDAIVRLGRQTSYERMAHLLVDLQRRLEVAGLTAGNRFPLPLTQEVLADALGLSIVHVNRTLQHLRRDGLIDIRGGMATLRGLEELQRVGAFGAEQANASRPHPWSAKQAADA